jgi:hypothetical protein
MNLIYYVRTPKTALEQIELGFEKSKTLNQLFESCENQNNVKILINNPKSFQILELIKLKYSTLFFIYSIFFRIFKIYGILDIFNLNYSYSFLIFTLI